MRELSLTSAREAWQLLRGLACVYKPPDFAISSLQRALKFSLVSGLNQLERSHEIKQIGNDSGNQLVTDYSLHPLVIGDGFEVEDVFVNVVNPISKRMSGLVILSLNNLHLMHKVRILNLPRTYRVGMKLGQATNTSFEGGKIFEKSTFDHLIGRPQILDRALASIRASHQRSSFQLSQISLQSQEAYELAAKGPIRPDRAGPTLIYGLKCIDYKPPSIELELTCVNESESYIAEFVAELGLQLKSNAVCSHIRCIRYGFFTLDNALLLKHVNLENILNNIIELKKIGRVHDNLKQTTRNIQSKVQDI